MTINHGYADVNGVNLHYAAVGNGKLMLFLHGFPEFWYAWRLQLEAFGGNYQAVAPDMRGYNLSSKPTDVHNYHLSVLAEDVASLIDYFGQRTAIVVGHDWGGGVAWEFAHAYPDRVEKLITINAPHPDIFRRELAHNPAQQKASEYILWFRSMEAEERLIANNFALLTDIMIKPGLQQGYFTEADHTAYLNAWSQPGAITGGLNYYRANNFEPRRPEPPKTGTQSTIAAPTLVIWGEKDEALLVSNLRGLEQYASTLHVERILDATHWIVHERSNLINSLIQIFLQQTE